MEDEEFLADSTLRDMAEQCRSTFFLGDMIPPYEEDDVIQILKYYAQYSEAPKFYTFEYTGPFLSGMSVSIYRTGGDMCPGIFSLKEGNVDCMQILLVKCFQAAMDNDGIS